MARICAASLAMALVGSFGGCAGASRATATDITAAGLPYRALTRETAPAIVHAIPMRVVRKAVAFTDPGYMAQVSCPAGAIDDETLGSNGGAVRLDAGLDVMAGDPVGGVVEVIAPNGLAGYACAQALETR